jgi:hypothetical protein
MMFLRKEFLLIKMIKIVTFMLILSWYQQSIKIFNYDTLIIQSDENIKYLYLHNLMIKTIFKAIEITKHCFNDRINWFFIEEASKWK